MLNSKQQFSLASLQLDNTYTQSETEEVVIARKPSQLADTVFLSELQPVTHSYLYPEWQDWVTASMIINSRKLTAACSSSLQLHSYYWPQVQTMVIKRKQRQFINRGRKFSVTLQCEILHNTPGTNPKWTTASPSFMVSKCSQMGHIATSEITIKLGARLLIRPKWTLCLHRR